MALTKCRECGAQISTKATACPSCGAAYKRTSIVTKAIAGLFAAGFVVTIIAAVQGDDQSDAPAPQATTPQQLAEQKASRARFQRAELAAGTLKSSLRDPASVQWEFIYTNDDASVVCMKYRAKNGFGGMSIEHTAMVGDAFSTDGNDWNAYCGGKSLHDLTYVRNGL